MPVPPLGLPVHALHALVANELGLPLPGSQPSSHIVRREHERAAHLAQSALGMLSCGSRGGHRQRGSAPFDTPMLSGLLATYFQPAGGARANGQHEQRGGLQNGWRSPRHGLLRHSGHQ